MTHPIDKPAIIRQICAVLRADLATLQAAFEDSHHNATHEESVAENKYDTRGLEAAYLAHGQAMRAEEIAKTLHAYEAIAAQALVIKPVVGLNSLVLLEDEHGAQRWLWLGTEAGGVKFNYDGRSITIVTPQSPLGDKLLGSQVDDGFTLTVNDRRVAYDVVEVY